MQKDNELRFSVTTDIDKAKADKRILAYANAYANTVKKQKESEKTN